jgi:hypothetical protein
MKISYTVSRGSIVDEDGLVQVLKEGKIGRSRINDVLVHTAVGDTRPRTPVAPQLARYSAELRCQIRDGTDAAARRRVPRRSVQRGPGSTGKPAQKCYIWRRSGQLAVAATGSFQLFAAQTLPAGSIDTSVSIWILPLLKTWMTSPVLVPAGCRERQKVGGQAALRSCSCVCGCGLNLGYQRRNMEFGLGHFVALGYARNW